MHTQVGPLFDERADEWGELGRILILGPTALADQPGGAVEVPSHDQDGALRAQRRLPDRIEEGSTIDQHGKAACVLEAPDVPAGSENSHAQGIRLKTHYETSSGPKGAASTGRDLDDRPDGPSANATCNNLRLPRDPERDGAIGGW